MPEMQEITFDAGIIDFKVNGACQVSFNPTDAAFAKRLYDAFARLETKQEARKKEVEEKANTVEIFDLAEQYDKEMREIVDGVFGVPVCDALFGEMNLYSMSNGLPVWYSFLLSVMDKIKLTAAKEQEAMQARIAKYTAKYKKK